MNYFLYVASLFRAATNVLVMLGWQPWGLCRVAAFASGVCSRSPSRRHAPVPYEGCRGPRT